MNAHSFLLTNIHELFMNVHEQFMIISPGNHEKGGEYQCKCSFKMMGAEGGGGGGDESESHVELRGKSHLKLLRGGRTASNVQVES